MYFVAYKLKCFTSYCPGTVNLSTKEVNLKTMPFLDNKGGGKELCWKHEMFIQHDTLLH